MGLGDPAHDPPSVPVPPRLASSVHGRRRRRLDVRLARSRWPPDAAKNPQRKRSCILLWMSGGPSQMDTFDLKPGHANGGEFKEIATNVPGMKISEHLPKIAKFGDRMAIVRSMSTKEGDHGRATFLMRTGYLPQGPIQYPTLGVRWSPRSWAATSATCRTSSASRPQRFLSPAAFGAGFLGPQYAPLVVGDSNGLSRRQRARVRPLTVQDLDLPSAVSRAAVRRPRRPAARHWRTTSSPAGPACSTHSHQAAYDRAVRLMRSQAAKAFNLDEETRRAARSLRPQPVRPGLPAGPPAGRARRALRRGQLGYGGSAGTRTRTTSTRSRP